MSTKPIRIIEFTNLDHLAGFKDLPPIVETNEAIYHFATGQKAKIVASKVVASPHLVIETQSQTTTPSYFNPVLKRLTISRFGKPLQGVYLEDYMTKRREESKVLHYHPLLCWSADLQGKGFPRAIPEGKWVIKPASGARSMSIVKMDTRRIHIRDLSNRFDRALNENALLGETIDAAEANGTKLDEGVKHKSKTELVDDFFKGLDIEYIRGTEFSKDEAAQALIDRALVVQQLNPFADAKEYRVLRAPGVHPVIYERQDLSDDHVGYSTSIGLLSYAENNRRMRQIAEEIISVMSDPKFPGLFGSVDIWISESEGVWGIYEYQPEYCSINIRQPDHDRFLRDSLDGLWKYCYGE